MDSGPFIGVISDTHGSYDPLIDDLFAGAERIVHAGDIGAGILDRLQRLAPVTAVLGSTDLVDMLPGVPQEAVVEALGLRILVGHIRDGLLRFRDLEAEGFDLVVSGHSHRAVVEWRRGVLLLNPGSAGSARFGLPRSVALVTLAAGRPRPKIVPLE